MRVSRDALYVGESQAGPVFGILHKPAGAVAAERSVLICPPFGWDEICCHRSLRDWADHLAGTGFPTLRIDLPGTGDSGGSPDEHDLLGAWVSAVGCAAGRLDAANGGAGVTAIGIGLGGIAACAALADGAPLDELVLWAVPGAGRRLIRELRAFARMESAKFEPSAHGRRQLNASDEVVAGGFRLSAETTGALERLDVAALVRGAVRVRRALLLGRDGVAADEQLHDALVSGGADVVLAPGAGYGAMMAEPQEARPPLQTFAVVGGWLASAPGRAASGSEVNGLAAGEPADVAADSAQMSVEEVPVKEQPLQLEQGSDALFAVLAEPAAPSSAPPLGAIFLNAGAIHHIGPNRMWVEAARRWAARGVPSLRLDLEGLGDSDGDGARFADVAELYVPEYADQVSRTIDLLEERGVARRFVLVGLCSGAYWSFHAALRDERVAAAFMVNPRTLFYDPRHETVRYLRRGLFEARSWRLLARGEVRPANIAAVVRRAPRAMLSRVMSNWRARADVDAVERAFDRLRDDGKHLTFVFSRGEPLHRELLRAGRLAQSSRWPNMSLDLISGNDHTLRPLHSQHDAHAALDRALERELAPSAQV